MEGGLGVNPNREGQRDSKGRQCEGEREGASKHRERPGEGAEMETWGEEATERERLKPSRGIGSVLGRGVTEKQEGFAKCEGDWGLR